MTDFSEKNQWTLIDKYISDGENGKISQFLRQNNYNFGEEIKHYSAVLEKYNKVKKFSAEDQKFIIEEGKRSGKNLLQKKYSHLIPSNIMPPPKQSEPREIINELRSPVDSKPKSKAKSFLEILASMNKEQKQCFFQIMDDVSENNLPKLLRLIEYSESDR
jgi:hypothetical protein